MFFRGSRKNGELVIGVVAPLGSALVKLGDAVDWTLRIELNAWKRENGPVEAAPLVVSRSIPGSKKGSWQGLDPFAVVALRVTLNDDGTATLVDIVDRSHSDGELEDRSAELQKPVVIRHEILGDMTLDRRVGWFEANVDWRGRGVLLLVESNEDLPRPGGVQTALELLEDQEQWHRRVRGYAADRMLELKNESWLDEDEAAVTRDQFLQSLTIEFIEAAEDGEFEFGFADGDLFGGHTILLSGDLRGGPRETDLTG